MFYVRYMRRGDLAWARTDRMTWSDARTVADGLAKFGLLVEVKEITFQMAMTRRAS